MYEARLLAGGPFFERLQRFTFNLKFARVLSFEDPPPVPFPITGELDLHTFDPRDLRELIPAWIAECQARGFPEVRIIHGKGTGTLRETVHALLRRSPLVINFRLGNEHTGSWGATLVQIRTA